MSERIVIKEICEVYDGPHATPKKTVDGPVYLGIDAITDDGKRICSFVRRRLY